MLRCVYVVAEAQLGATLRQAAGLLAEAETPLSVELRGFTIDELTQVDPELLRNEINQADVFLGSMLNSDAEVALLAEMLQHSLPPATLVFTSQPELMVVSRLGEFDARELVPGNDQFDRLVKGLHGMGVRLPPSPHALLAATPRLARRLDERMLGPLWLYAQAGSYWLNASPENFAQLFYHIATQLPQYRDRFTPAPPILFPDVALWHPAAADEFFHSYDEYDAWYRSVRNSGERSASRAEVNGSEAASPEATTPDKKRPTVGVIVFRQYVTGGTYRHYEAMIEALESEGLNVVCGFGGMDNSSLVERFFRPAGVDLLLNLTGFNLVGSMGRPQPDRAVALLKSLDIPYLVPFPLLFQTTEQWTTHPIGLAPMQTALQVVMPELEGATEPRVFAGKGDDGDFFPAPVQLARLARRVRRWIELRTKPAAQRRIAITIFSFPPDKGSVGSAAYLDVFRSIHHLLSRLHAAGFDVEVPENADRLMQMVLGAEEALPGAPDIAVADSWSAERYKELMPAHERIERNFGQAPGFIDSDGQRLRIRGRAFGNVFIGVQPGFGYEGDPMRLLFAKDATPSHSFAAYYTWLEHVWGADAMLHMGTHGALEFMPGKQVGLTEACWPDMLVGDTPHVYFYSMNNPSEATIAKRRSYATMVTYLSPPLREAGLYRSLLTLRDALSAYREANADVERARAFETVLALVEETSLSADIGSFTTDESPDDYVRRVGSYVRTLAERLIPVGLHVAGQSVTDQEAAEFLWAALQHPRPERNVPGLPHLVAAERGLDWELLDVNDVRRDDIARAARDIVDELVAGRFTPSSVPEWQALSAFGDDFLQRLRAEQELDALVRAISGRYVEPAPGGDPARVPDALPTGRNLHALDPHRIPSPTARRHAAPVVRQLLDKLVAQEGRYPETIACVLWGTDNIKTEGEAVAQIFELIGVEPVPDSLGRMTRLRLIPPEQLGRPRIDVVLSVSGIFRDIFPNVMTLLDEAIQLAAAADEDPEQNYIRKHALAIQEELSLPFQHAARRLFSNAPGSYGTGVNNVVEASSWETTEELGDVFVERKGYVFGDESFSHRPELLDACLKTCTATFQNLDSTEIGLSDVDHYFEYLGGLVAATQRVRGAAPDAFIADTLSPNQTVRTVEETVRLETRTRLLNPRWYEGMLKHGYQGVHEIATRLDNTFGWSATADAVDEWIYTAAADTFLFDDEMRERLTKYNPRALQRMAGRLAEADERGFWQPDDERRMKLRDILMHAEDVIEGVV